MAELAMAALIAAFGYYSAHSTRERMSYADILTTHKDSESARPSDLVGDYVARAERRWADARAPQVSGVITPQTRPGDMMPFFRSGKTMNTSTSTKQRRLEMYTGTPNASAQMWKPKAEVEAMFPETPQGTVTSAGTVGNPAGDVDLQKSRVVAGRAHHGVGPTETVRVGPGLGVGPEVQATGGFHPFFRPEVRNINEHRLNDPLPGGVNHGASRVSKRAQPVGHSTNKNPDALVWTMDDRPLEATKAAVHAPVAPTQEGRGYVGKTEAGGRVGIASAAGVAGGAVARVPEMRAPTNAREFAPPTGNPSASRSAFGAYVVPGGLDALPTQREQSFAHLPGVLRGGTVGAGTLRPATAPAPTNRDLTGDRGYLAPVAGPRAQRVRENLDNSGIVPTKREGQSRAHTNHGGRMNVFDPSHRGLARVREAKTYSGLEHARGRAPVAIPLGVLGARERAGPKADPENRRMDLGIARAQLGSNPLNHHLAA